jgi:hypothetical protein
LTLEDGGTVDLTPYINTDNQQITAFSLDGTTNVLTITLEDGGTQTVDLSAVSTDDQDLSTDSTPGNISIEDGNTITLNVNDSDSVIGNEYNTGSGISAGSVEITDGGGTESVNVISTDANNNIIAGTDGALYLNVSSVAIAETNTTLGFNGATNELTYTNELGDNPVLNLSGLNTDDQALSLDGVTNVLTLEDGGTVDLSPYINTDDQQITAFSLDGTTNVLTITLEDGGTQTVDLSAVSTDDQALSLDALTNVLTLEDGGTVDLSPYINTDDQQITAFSLDGTTNVLTLTLEDGGTATADLSALDNVGTDDQIANEVNITDTAGNFTATGVEGALAELAGLTDDDVSITNIKSGNTIATISEPGITAVDINETITTLATVDNTTYTYTSEDNTTISFDGSDNQNIANLAFSGTTLTVGIEDGSSQTVSLATLQDNQSIQGSVLSGTTLTIGIEDGSSETVNLSSLANTDNQNIENLALSGTTLTVGIEDGTSQTVNLSALADHDWYEVGTTTAPDNINDNIFTQGRVGIGVAPSTELDVNGNARVRTLPASADTDQLVTADVNGNLRKVNSLKASKVFYPPSIEVDASVNGTFSIDLHAQYIAQFGSPVVSSAGTIPTYTATELDYHVTYADPTVFNTGSMNITPAGVLTYTIVGQPLDYNSLINVVFVVK